MDDLLAEVEHPELEGLSSAYILRTAVLATDFPGSRLQAFLTPFLPLGLKNVLVGLHKDESSQAQTACVSG